MTEPAQTAEDLQREIAALRAQLAARDAALAEQIAHQSAIADILKVMSSTTSDTQPVFDIILRRAIELSGAKFGGLFELENGQVRISAHAGWDSDTLANYLRLYPRPAARSWLMDVCMLDGRTVYLRDAWIPAEIPGFEHPAAADTVKLMALRKLGFRSQIDVPLMRDGVGIGCIVVAHENTDGFTDAHIDLLKTFAEQAVIAIGSVATFRALQTRTAELSASLDNLRTTQTRLVQTEKLASLGQLTAGIAHEIKNPLNFVNNFSELSTELLDELTNAIAANDPAEIADLTATLKSNLDKIAHHGRRADSIVKNMLLHSRTGTAEIREIDLNAAVEEALNLAYHGARAARPGFNITLEKHLDPEAGRVALYPQEFTRVLLNLIANGFYAAEKRRAEPGFEPTLAITTSGTPDHVEIRIRDNGTGIPPSLREKIFEPFFTTKPAGEGTGLGLSLSHDVIVKQHAGQLTVDSQPNHHTEFTITLPRHMAAGNPS